MHWYVLYIKPRNEKKAAFLLEKMGVTVYCPLITQIHQWSDRKKKVEVPLINSYLFVQLEEKERELVFQVPGVVRYVFWLGKPAKVRDQEIVVLKEWLNGENVDVTLEKLKPGAKMNIDSGPFEGKEGIVHQVDKNRVQLLLADLGMKITLKRNI
ncbi:MAG: UpxY family transcription antiterminator [Bacteroidetes bacterium]|nr:UpxY family transcription antiterminator [Bacteroidota bacterium]